MTSRHDPMSGAVGSNEDRIAPDSELISVVVPVFDNSRTLARLTDRVCAAVAAAGKSAELVLVDDCSADSSWSVIASLARTCAAPIRGFRLPSNAGQHTAVLLGLSHARGAWCVVLDADLQDPPEVIPALLAAGIDPVDVVFAGRQGRYQRLARRLTGLFSRLLLSLLVGVPRSSGMFFAIRRAQVDRMLDLCVSAVSVVAMIGLIGSVSTSVPVERAARAEGQSAYTWGGRLRVGLQMCRCIIEARGWRLRGTTQTRLGFRRSPIRTRIDALSRACARVGSGPAGAAGRDFG
jgi:polyisoprenyl-phosphate glycosyltransferase